MFDHIVPESRRPLQVGKRCRGHFGVATDLIFKPDFVSPSAAAARAVTASATGLRTARRISHVFIMDLPTYPETLFITDAAINIFPDLDAKRDIIQNAIDLFTQVGLGTPRVAILSAVNIDAVAVDVATLDFNLAEIDADPQHDVACFGMRSVRRRHPLLQLDCADDRVDRAGKFHQHTIAHQLDDASMVLCHQGIEDAPPPLF